MPTPPTEVVVREILSRWFAEVRHGTVDPPPLMFPGYHARAAALAAATYLLDGLEAAGYTIVRHERLLD